MLALSASAVVSPPYQLCKQTASGMLAVMATIYVRAVPGELDAWLDEQARDLGMSKAGLCRLILATARAERWPNHRFNKEGNGNAAVQPPATTKPLLAVPAT